MVLLLLSSKLISAVVSSEKPTEMAFAHINPSEVKKKKVSGAFCLSCVIAGDV